MDEQVADDVAFELELEPEPGPRRGRSRLRVLGGVALGVAVVSGVLGAAQLAERSEGGTPQAVEIEPASAAVVPTPSSSVVIADGPPTSDAPEPDPVATTVVSGPRTTIAPVAPAASEEPEVAIDGPPEVDLPPAPAPRFRVVPGPPLPVGSPLSGLVSGEVRLGPGGKTYGPLAPPQPGVSLEDLQPDFVAYLMNVDHTTVLCGYMARGAGSFSPEGVPIYDVDGSTVVARSITGRGCVPLDQLESAS